MNQLIHKLLSVPQFEDEQRNSLARILHAFLLAIYAALIVSYLTLLFTYPQSWSVFLPFFIAPFIIITLLYVLFKNGYFKQVCIALPILIFLLLEYFAWTTGGLSSVAFYAFSVVILLAGLLSGIRAASIYTALVALTGVSMLLVQLYGKLPILYSNFSMSARLSSLIIVVLFIAGIFTITLQNKQQALQRARKELEEREQAELEREAYYQQLQASEARFRRLAENAQDIIYRYRATPPMGFEYLSPVVERITGYTLREFSEHPDLIANLTAPGEICPLLNAITPDKPVPPPILHRFTHKNGSELWLENQAVPLFDAEGNLEIVEGIIRDVTERKHAEATLIESQKLAELGTLAAGIAHEINSPLQVVTGVSERTLGRLDNGNPVDKEDVVRGFKTINQSAWRIAGIVHSLLAYARQSDEKMAFFDLQEIVRDALTLVEHQMKVWSNVTIHTVYANDLPFFFCNRNKIIQVLINLLINARDAMPNGGTITLRGQYLKDSDRIELRVSDTGTGIPDEIRRHIFEPFFTTKPEGIGTGLGLSIVAEIVRAYGGEIDVNSSPHIGTTFTLRFPRQLGGGNTSSIPSSAGGFIVKPPQA